MDHEDYKEMLAAQALSALDPEDARALEAHLRGCSECRSEFYAWEETAARLAFSALESKPLEPSSQLRGRILEATRADSAGAAEHADGDRARASNVIPLNQRQLRVWTPAQTWGAIAAALVFVVLIASLFVLWQQNRAARLELARLSRQIQDTQEQLGRLRKFSEIVSAPGMRMAQLAGTNVMPGASATLAFDQSGHAVLMAKGLPSPPEGKAYQLWFIAGNRPMPGRVFTTDPSGTGMLSDQVPAEALNGAVFAITLEPKDGVQAPTGPKYLKS